MRSHLKLALVSLVSVFLAGSCANPVRASLGQETMYKDWYYTASASLDSIMASPGTSAWDSLFPASTIGLSLANGWEFGKISLEGLWGAKASPGTTGSYPFLVEKTELIESEVWVWGRGEYLPIFYALCRLSKDGKTLTVNFKDSGYPAIDEAYSADTVSGPLTLHQ